jgi:hypothetical protein
LGGLGHVFITKILPDHLLTKQQLQKSGLLQSFMSKSQQLQPKVQLLPVTVAVGLWFFAVAATGPENTIW